MTNFPFTVIVQRTILPLSEDRPAWCRANIGQKGLAWSIKWSKDYDNVIYGFVNEQQAVFFALKWL